MPRPKSAREASQEELDEWPALISNLRRELAATPAVPRGRREGLEWRIRRAEMRMAELRERLAAGSAPDDEPVSPS